MFVVESSSLETLQLIYNSETGCPLTLSDVSFQYVRGRKYKTDRETSERERVCLWSKERGGVGMSKIKSFSHNSLHPLFSFHEAACERVTCSIRRARD